MSITVIICTYNRCRILAKTLESIAASQFPDSVTCEVLVVDNNSSDQTREVVEDICRRHPGRFRYLFEPRAGKSHALNTGVREARGDILAFIDDDVKVEPTCLQNLTAILHNGEWAGTGGRTLLAEPCSPPRWMALEGPYSLGGALASLFDLGDEPCDFEPYWPPYGANMAFQRRVFEKYGLFRTDLGPRPGSTIRSDDTEFGRRVMAAGERLRYEPSAVAYHPVFQERINKDYFLGWWFDYGRAEALQWGRRPDIYGIPRPYFNILKIVTIDLIQRLWRWIVASNPQRRFFCKCQVWMIAGEISELYKFTERNETNRTAIPERFPN